MAKLVKRFLAISFIFVLFISCTKKEEKGIKILNVSISAKVKGMDPIYASDKYSSNEVSNVYEGLLEYHYLKRPYTLKPNLAESMPEVSPDGLTYTFQIKKGVLFHDDKCFPGGIGRELVAEDFVYSIKRLADPKLQSLGWWVLDGKISGLNEWRKKYKDSTPNYSDEIEGLKAIGPHTLQVKLARPFPQFLYSLAMPFTFAVAKEAVETYGKEFLNHPIGTGPFILPVFKQSNKIIYIKNPKFRKKLYPSVASDEFVKKGYLLDAGKRLPLLDKIIVNIIVESQPKWLNFQKGKIDFIGIPKDNFEMAITPSKELSPDFIKKGIQLSIEPSLDVTYIAFNHDHKIFKDIRVRQAMSLAYDVNASNKLFYNDTAMPAESVVPPGIAGYIKGYKNPNRGPDYERAKKLLAEAGYPGGKGFPVIKYETTSGTVSRQMAEFFKKQMAKIGIIISVSQNPWPELNKKITNRSAMLWGIAWGADYPDAENFLQLLYGPNRSPGANGAGFDDPTYNKLFARSSMMQDSPQRTAMYKSLNKIAAEKVPWIYGVHRQHFILYQGWLQNFINTDFEWGQSQYLNINLKKKELLIEKF